jgi:lipoprotein-anchoring transpeptidase ErfK/SrfK
VIIILICAAIGVAAWTAVSSPVRGLTAQATPTPGLPFAVLEIAKPKATPTALLPSPIPPVILPTDSPTAIIPAATETPAALPTSQVYAEIVVDTPPAPGYSNTTQYDPPPSYSGNKYILVDISEQHMYVYEGDTQVYSFVSSTGMNNATRTGSFSVLDKIPSAYGATWDIWMPNWLGIYWAGSMENGIHALPILPNGGTLWAGYLGVPISYGCVVLGTYEAQVLYDWADIGTPVEIQW